MKLLLSFVAPGRWPLLLAVLLAGCARPEAPLPPPNLLPASVVTSILIRIHLLEARVEGSHMNTDSTRALYQSQQVLIFKKYGITPADSSFQHSYRYYAVHNKDLDEIYAAVIDSLVVRDKSLGGNPVVVHP
ncbi:DUF4296 domain-containing protein [Hymenobacter ginkgonis]|uniref:DUF4296 domain-containing protein n=1 Tax=Hymenobacter ginkgonis TaxID=2682976 RepID=UPI0018DC5ADD|nr:DUF4296 domain-containing protein [Hymenobacter ginkgonis]